MLVINVILVLILNSNLYGQVQVWYLLFDMHQFNSNLLKKANMINKTQNTHYKLRNNKGSPIKHDPHPLIQKLTKRIDLIQVA